MNSETLKIVRNLGYLLEEDNTGKHIINAVSARELLKNNLASRIEESVSSEIRLLCLDKEMNQASKLENYESKTNRTISNGVSMKLITQRVEVGFKNKNQIYMYAFVNIPVDIYDNTLDELWKASAQKEENLYERQKYIASEAIKATDMFEDARYTILWGKYLILQGYVPLIGKLYNGRPCNMNTVSYVDYIVDTTFPSSENFYLSDL